MTIEEIKDTLQTWIRTADDEYDREEMGRVCGLKSALHLIEKLDVPDTNVGELIKNVLETLRNMDNAIDVICELDVDAVLDQMEVDR